MTHTWTFVILLSGALAALPGAWAQQGGGAAEHPLAFEPNEGQFAAGSLFGASHPRWTALAAPGELRVEMRRTVGDPGPRGDAPGRPADVRNLLLRFEGSARPAPLAEHRRQGRSDYFWGKDAANWMTNIPHFGRIRYRDVWPGVDAVVSATARAVVVDFLLRAGADLSAIAIRCEGSREAVMEGAGEISLPMPWGAVRLRKPLDEQRRAAAGQYELTAAGRVRFVSAPASLK